MIKARMISALLTIICCLCLLATQTQSTEESMDKQLVIDSETTEDSAYPTIGQLKMKDKLIIIKSGPDGPLYTVESNNGKVMAVGTVPPKAQLKNWLKGITEK